MCSVCSNQHNGLLTEETDFFRFFCYQVKQVKF